MSMVDVETFDLGRQVVGEGVFDAAAAGPADIGVSSCCRRSRTRQPEVVVQVAIGQTAGHVDEGPVEREAARARTVPK